MANKEQPQKKSGCLSKFFIGLLIFFFISGFLPGGKNDTNTTDPGVTTKATEKATARATKTPRPTATPKPTHAPVSKEDMKSMIEKMFANGYSYCKVEILDEGFGIAVSTENIGQAAYYANVTKDEAILKEWDIMTNNMVYKCIQVQEYVESYGLENQLIMFSLVNDENTNLSLVSIINGAIIHNAVK